MCEENYNMPSMSYTLELMNKINTCKSNFCKSIIKNIVKSQTTVARSQKGDTKKKSGAGKPNMASANKTPWNNNPQQAKIRSQCNRSKVWIHLNQNNRNRISSGLRQSRNINICTCEVLVCM